MDTKNFRKELELALTQTIEDVLNECDKEIAVAIQKTVYGASKTIAKKFYKVLKTQMKAKASKNKATSKPTNKKTKAVKKAVAVKTSAKGKK